MNPFKTLFLLVSLLPAIGWAITLCPDYAGITHPVNIAPLNFDVQGATITRVCLTGRAGAQLDYTTGHIRHDLAAWRAFCQANVGSSYQIAVYTADPTTPAWTARNTIAPEPIDPYLAYRLIPPSYEGFTKLGIYQRNLTTFEEKPIYENRQLSMKQCVNCHTFCNGDPEQLMMHVRAYQGGTLIFAKGRKPIKRDFQTAPLFGSGVYPAWHPSGRYIVYSINETMQNFYAANRDKIEVQDSRSDLMIYDLQSDTAIAIELDANRFECFPTWSPDGKELYTVAADLAAVDKQPDKQARGVLVSDHYNKMHYNLYVRTFDAEKTTFSKPQLLINAAQSQFSVTHPRLSPDGRWLMLTAAPYGVFHIWHKSADLYLVDLQAKSMRFMSEVNSNDVESYHTFASNGAWFVFATRRDDGAYTRPYFAHFDTTTGKASKPFILPVKDPIEHRQRMLSYNLPELIKGPVPYSPRTIRQMANAAASKPSQTKAHP